MGCLCVKPKVDYDMKLAENSLKLSQTRQAILEKSIKNMLDINQGFDNETPNKSSNYKSNNVDSTSNYNSNLRNTDVSEVKKNKGDHKNNSDVFYGNSNIKSKASLLNYKKKKLKLHEEESDFAIINIKKSN